MGPPSSSSVCPEKVLEIEDVEKNEENNGEISDQRRRHQEDALIQALTSLKDQAESTLAFLEKQSSQQSAALLAINEALVSLGVDQKQSLTPSQTAVNNEAAAEITSQSNSSPKKERKWNFCWSYLKWRIKESAFLKLVSGESLEVGDCDEVMNALILVNALILTIPFGVFPDMEYWSNMREVMKLPNCVEDEDKTFNAVYTYFRRTYFCVIYPSLGVVVVSLLYYLLRPRKDEDFLKWWKVRNGREILFLSLLGSLISIFAIFYLAAFMFQFYSLDPAEVCDNINYDSIAYSYTTIFVIAMYVLLRHA